MLLLSSQIKGLEIISLQTGQTVGKLGDPVFNSQNLELAAFLVTGHKQPTALLTRDIRQFAKDCVVIDSAEDLEDPTEIVRLDELLRSKFKLPGISVVTMAEQKLGKVEDYALNLENNLVQKLHVRVPLLKSLMQRNLIIDRNQIIDISPKQITVKDTFELEKKAVIGPQPAKPMA